MARVQVVLNRAGMHELANSQTVEDKLHPYADAVLAAAEAIAPVETGAYKASLRKTVTHTDRVVVRVESTAPYALNVEDAHGTLAKALSAAGGAD